MWFVYIILITIQTGNVVGSVKVGTTESKEDCEVAGDLFIENAPPLTVVTPHVLCVHVDEAA